MIDGFVKSPYAALRFKTRHCDVHTSTPHSSFLARLASGAFYKPVAWSWLLHLEKSSKFLRCHSRKRSASGILLETEKDSGQAGLTYEGIILPDSWNMRLL